MRVFIPMCICRTDLVRRVHRHLVMTMFSTEVKFNKICV